MAKASYTDDEIRQILHSLFTEKKRTKELTLQLQSSKKEELEKKLNESQILLKTADEETSSLREQVQKLRSMVQQSQREEPLSDEDKTLAAKLHESQQHAMQLERVIAFLRGKSEEAQAESKQLEEEFTSSQTTLNELQQALNEEREELRAIQGQFSSLKTQLADAKKKQESAETALEEALKQQTAVGPIEEEIRSIKIALADAIRQAEEIEKEYLTAVDAEASAQNASTQLLSQNRELLEEVRLLKEQITEAYNAEQQMQVEASQQIDQLLRQRDQAKQQMQEAKQIADQLRGQQSDLKNRLKDAEERAIKAEAQHREQEFEIRTAHQHLAKKVKETTLLSEQLEEIRLRQLESQRNYEGDKMRLIDLQNRVNLEEQSNKRLEHKLQETEKHTEEQIKRWEEKYFKLCERLQEAEARNKELQLLEEKYNQMQSILSSLGNFMNHSGMIINPPAPTREIRPTYIPEPVKEPSTDLFDTSFHDKPRIKQDLFE